MIVRRFLVVALLAATAAGVAVWLVTAQPPWYLRLRYPLRYQAIVEGHARNYRLDPALLAAVIYAESKFHANARSSSGAIGLMQLTPATAHGIAIRTGGSRFQTADLLDQFFQMLVHRCRRSSLPVPGRPRREQGTLVLQAG